METILPILKGLPIVGKEVLEFATETNVNARQKATTINSMRKT